MVSDEIINSLTDPYLKTKICRRWARQCCPRTASECRYAHGPNDRHQRPRRRKKRRCQGGGLKELRLVLPHGDVGRNINSFLFHTHPDALAWQQEYIKKQRIVHQKMMENCDPPRRLTFILERHCYCCQASDVDVYHRYYYPKCWNWNGWIFCVNCKRVMEEVVIPYEYEQRGDLPPSCFAGFDQKRRFFFDRVSQSRPEKNGLTNCTFSQEDGPLFYMCKDTILCTVIWTDEGEDWKKTIPLSDVLRVSKRRWPTVRSFLDEFKISPKNPIITPILYKKWVDYLKMNV